MSPAGFEHVVPASVRPQKHALDRTATGIAPVPLSRHEFYVLDEVETDVWRWEAGILARVLTTTVEGQRKEISCKAFWNKFEDSQEM